MGIHNPPFVKEIEEDVTVLRAILAIETLTETGDTITTDSNEQNLYINNAPSGVFFPLNVMLDFTNHTASETLVVKIYYKIKSGGTFRLLDEETFTGVQDPVLVAIGLEPNRHGIKVTIKKTAGTNRAYDWEVCYKA